MNRMMLLFIKLALIVLMGLPVVVNADSTKYATAEAVRVSPFLSGEMGQKIQFTFEGISEGNAWLKQTGQWHAESWIKHTHFRCAHYRLGIQFGKGEPACLNVKWYGDPVYISRKRQCNNVSVHHTGSSEQRSLVDAFSEVTCARQVIKCSGVCD